MQKPPQGRRERPGQKRDAGLFASNPDAIDALAPLAERIRPREFAEFLGQEQSISWIEECVSNLFCDQTKQVIGMCSYEQL